MLQLTQHQDSGTCHVLGGLSEFGEQRSPLLARPGSPLPASLSQAAPLVMKRGLLGGTGHPHTDAGSVITQSVTQLSGAETRGPGLRGRGWGLGQQNSSQEE